MINRFKEFNRVKKERKPKEQVESTIDPLKSSPKPVIRQKIAYPEIPEGKNQTSFNKHNRLIQAEFKKSRPNLTVTKECITRSYPMRRVDILENTYGLNEVFKKYPFLTEPDKVSKNKVFFWLDNYVVHILLDILRD